MSATPEPALLGYLISKTNDHGLSLFAASVRDPDSTYWRDLLQGGMLVPLRKHPSLVRGFFEWVVACGDGARATECVRAYLAPLTVKQRQHALALKAEGTGDSLLSSWVHRAVTAGGHYKAVPDAMLVEAFALQAVDFGATRNYRLRRGGSVPYTPLQAALEFSVDPAADWWVAHGAPIDQRVARTLLHKDMPTARVIQFFERNQLDPRLLEPELGWPAASPDTVGALRALYAREAAHQALRKVAP